MSQEILQSIIDDFSPEKFSRFFRNKNRFFAPQQKTMDQYNDENFRDGLKLGEIKFSKTEKLIISALKVKKSLSERSGKKSQYEKAKTILKETQSDTGIFIFYDRQNNFRFSLIYANYLGTRRDWSNFRRFTYFVSSEFTNKTFLQRIGNGDFSSLEKIKDAFSVEKVTKSFYTNIANWYFWAVQKSNFPKDAENEDNGRNIAIIRMITRLIFIWFMREKGLIEKHLFNYQNISELLKDLSPEKTTYYKAILQNLFFSTLNTRIEDRKFRFKITGWKNSNYMDHKVYRYEDHFKNQEDMLEIFKDIPFLNGGLFDCLDRKIVEAGRNIEIRIDGFSDKAKGLNVPNFLFFSGEKDVDLNKEYGTKNKKYKVHGLIDILSSYNFTIDENEPNDQEVALDPELLGKVFENLLASFNPETASTARKATGSYYTPREIVDYMVTQSLKEYFKTHLKDIEGLDEKLNRIFSSETEENPFSEPITKKVVELIDDLRVVDPAVGSGAFPMGILNRLVFILSKLDPHNNLWKETQMNAVEASVTDPVLKKDLKDHIAKRFAEKNLDYGRKLYLIQKCIYGVDIQQIAVEIAKLRFFISLLVDEKIDKEKENWGIEPLPNLDFKIMQGNSLISEFMGINFDADEKENSGKFVFKDEVNDLIELFQQKKNEFQDEPEKNKKDKIKQEVEDLIINIFEAKLKNQKAGYFRKLKAIEEKSSMLRDEKQRKENIAKEKQAVYKKEGFNLETAEKQLREFTSGQKVKPFFLWELYFSEVFHEKQGFDIVIANPPYVTTKYGKIDQTHKEQYLRNFDSAYDKIDLYVLFFEQAIKISKKYGVTTFITPWNFLNNFYSFKIRKFLLDNVDIKTFLKLPPRVFGSVIVDNIISIFRKNTANESNVIVFDDLFDPEKKYLVNQRTYLKNDNFVFKFASNDIADKILNKTNVDAVHLGQIALNYIGIMTGGQKEMIADEPIFSNSKPVLSGKEMGKWFYKDKGYFVNFDRSKIHSNDNETVYLSNPKILLRKTGKDLAACLDEKQYYTIQSLYNIIIKNTDYSAKYILALLNSELFNFLYNKFFITNPEVFPYIKKRHLDQFPVKQATQSQQDNFIKIVDKILAITKSSDYLENPAKKEEVKEYEKQIDQMVYKLYDLTDEEIKIVGNF